MAAKIKRRRNAVVEEDENILPSEVKLDCEGASSSVALSYSSQSSTSSSGPRRIWNILSSRQMDKNNFNSIGTADSDTLQKLSDAVSQGEAELLQERIPFQPYEVVTRQEESLEDDRHQRSSSIPDEPTVDNIAVEQQQMEDAVTKAKYNGLSREKINLPCPIVRRLPYGLLIHPVATGAVETLTHSDFLKLAELSCKFITRIEEHGFVLVKIQNENSDALNVKALIEKYRHVKNLLPQSKNDILSLKMNGKRLRQKTLPNQIQQHCRHQLPLGNHRLIPRIDEGRPIRASKLLASSIIRIQADDELNTRASTSKESGKNPSQDTISTARQTTPVLSNQALFLELHEIRNLGRGLFHIHRFCPEDAIKRLPELNGMTLGQIIDFTEEIFSFTNNDSLEGRKENAEKLLRILHTLKPDPTMTDEGLLIPVIVNWDFMQIDGDQNVAGLCVDSASNWITDFFKTLIPPEEAEPGKDDQDKEAGCLGRINTPSPLSILEVIECPKRTHGFMGTPIPIQMGKFNGLNMLDHLVIGSPKLNFIIPAKHCHHIREEVSNYLEKIAPNVVTNNSLQAPFKDAVIKPCVMQHECIFVTPMFLRLREKSRIPYTAVLQETGEMLILGAGSHFEALSLGPNVSRLQCFLLGDYYKKTTELTIQCDKEATLSRQQIWRLEEESKKIDGKGVTDIVREVKSTVPAPTSKNAASCVPSASTSGPTSFCVLSSQTVASMLSPPLLKTPSPSSSPVGGGEKQTEKNVTDSLAQSKRKRGRRNF